MRRLIAGVRCVEFGVTDLARATDFYERVWTLRSVERKAEVAFLRGQGSFHHMLILRQSRAPAIHRLVFQAADTAALHELHVRIGIRGLPVSERIRELDTPGGGRSLARGHKPRGNKQRGRAEDDERRNGAVERHDANGCSIEADCGVSSSAPVSVMTRSSSSLTPN